MRNEKGQFVNGHKEVLGKRFFNRKRLSEKDRIKKSKEVKKQWKDGKRKSGWKVPKDSIERMRKSLIKYWDEKGRKQYKRYIHLHNTPEYIKWRLDVFTRDSFTCQGCKNVGGYLQAHHIKSWAKYPKLRFNISNGVCLCRSCHKLTNNFGNKK